MTLECFKKQFADAKRPMSLEDAANYICRMRVTEFPYLRKTWKVNEREYCRRVAQRSACDEIEAALRSASPWQDYREIIAELEWPYMRRIAIHSMEERYSGPEGKRLGEADTWFIDHWLGLHDVFRKMPGIMPDITSWRVFDTMIGQAEKELKKYRRSN